MWGFFLHKSLCYILRFKIVHEKSYLFDTKRCSLSKVIDYSFIFFQLSPLFIKGRHSGMNRKVFRYMFYSADALPSTTQYWESNRLPKVNFICHV